MKKKYVIKTIHGYLVTFEMLRDSIEAYVFLNVLLLERVKRSLVIENAEIEEI